ncbi:MAG: alpha amylase C-terminal domain-containing protein [Bacteriovoracaceae bacterium]|nr:alpha amylase C-terminal domain-containing protein [Bacteriovoracaceae bacterium]
MKNIQKLLNNHPHLYLVGSFIEDQKVLEQLESIKVIENSDWCVPKLVQDDGYLTHFKDIIKNRQKKTKVKEFELVGKDGDLSSFATGYHYFGLHRTKKEWIFREWAPNATAIYFVGDFNGWQEDERFKLKKKDVNGVWEIHISFDDLAHKNLYRLKVYWEGGDGDRIPSYSNYVVQDEKTHIFNAQVWSPPNPYEFKQKIPSLNGQAPLIYESHVGMAQIEGKVGSYKEYIEHTLPRIVKAGYNTIQLMAIQEHPYYGSFGYQVSSFFAPSSRFGNPDELKELVDAIHKEGLMVIMDIVHSHAVKNEIEGLAKFDGTSHQYFHEGAKGQHPSWDTMCFNYGKNQVLHFLLSNCKYWIEEFKFDGFRFDGVTSMLYFDHGLGKAFSSYDDYFNPNVDEDVTTYFSLANKLIHQINPNALTIAEDMSGMPGLGMKFENGGVGFDYRLAMGIPDFWIKQLKEKSDEDWNMEIMFYELINRRDDEGTITYVESHDQALVGDKTIIFRLIDKDMYTNMGVDNRNLMVDRGIALHKMIRLLTATTGGSGYLNFMGNEFGHPEWVDFPREGNNWSYHYARRQWNLVDEDNLCYKFLGQFDQEMVKLLKDYSVLGSTKPNIVHVHVSNHTLVFSRSGLLFLFNFDASNSYTDYSFDVPQGEYKQLFSSDCDRFGGHNRLEDGQIHHTTNWPATDLKTMLSVYLPARTAIVLKKL